MKKQLEKTAAAVSLIVGYLAIVGVGVWRATKRSRPQSEGGKDSESGKSKAEPRNQEKDQDEKLQRLSLTTPGNAPLDQLARRAAAEGREKQRGEAIGDEGVRTDPKPSGPPRSWTHDSAIVAEVLQHQSLQSEPLQGWSIPMPERLPVPTFAPAVMALGIIVFAMGLATIWYVCVVGAIVFAIAAWRWTGELQGD